MPPQVWLSHGTPPLTLEGAKGWLMRAAPTTDFQYAMLCGLFSGQRCGGSPNPASSLRLRAGAMHLVRGDAQHIYQGLRSGLAEGAEK